MWDYDYDDEEQKRLDEEYDDYVDSIEEEEEYERQQFQNWYWYEHDYTYGAWGDAPNLFDEEDD